MRITWDEGGLVRQALQAAGRNGHRLHPAHGHGPSLRTGWYPGQHPRAATQPHCASSQVLQPSTRGDLSVGPPYRRGTTAPRGATWGQAHCHLGPNSGPLLGITLCPKPQRRLKWAAVTQLLETKALQEVGGQWWVGVCGRGRAHRPGDTKKNRRTVWEISWFPLPGHLQPTECDNGHRGKVLGPTSDVCPGHRGAGSVC